MRQAQIRDGPGNGGGDGNGVVARVQILLERSHRGDIRHGAIGCARRQRRGGHRHDVGHPGGGADSQVAEVHGDAGGIGEHGSLRRAGGNQRESRGQDIGERDGLGRVWPAIGDGINIRQRTPDQGGAGRNRRRQGQVGQVINRVDAREGEAPAVGDDAVIAGALVVNIERPRAIGVHAIQGREGRRVRAGRGIGREGGRVAVSGGLIAAGYELAVFRQGVRGGTVKGQVDAADGGLIASARHEQRLAAARGDDQHAHIRRITVVQIRERDGHPAQRAGKVGDVDDGRIWLRRAGLLLVRGIRRRRIRDDNGVGIGNDLRGRQGEGKADRRMGIGPILDQERGADGAARRTIGRKTKGASDRKAAGEQDAVGLGLVGGNRDDAIGGQQGGDQVSGAAIAGVAQAQSHGNGFAGIKRAINRPALKGQGGARGNNVNKRRRHRYDRAGGVVGEIGVRLRGQNTGRTGKHSVGRGGRHNGNGGFRPGGQGAQVPQKGVIGNRPGSLGCGGRKGNHFGRQQIANGDIGSGAGTQVGN